MQQASTGVQLVCQIFRIFVDISILQMRLKIWEPPHMVWMDVVDCMAGREIYMNPWNILEEWRTTQRYPASSSVIPYRWWLGPSEVTINATIWSRTNNRTRNSRLNSGREYQFYVIPKPHGNAGEYRETTEAQREAQRWPLRRGPGILAGKSRQVDTVWRGYDNSLGEWRNNVARWRLIQCEWSNLTIKRPHSGIQCNAEVQSEGQEGGMNEDIYQNEDDNKIGEKRGVKPGICDASKV